MIDIPEVVALLRVTFNYDETSRSGLRWKIGKRAGREAAYLLRRKNGTDYWTVKAWGHFLRVHRVVWAIHHGALGRDLDVDHWDGDGLNNCIGNLRAVTRAVNQRNRGVGRKNVLGCVGVTEDLRAGSFVATWSRLDGTQGKERFYVRDHGRILAFDLAVKFRQDKINELQNQGAGYSARHLSMSGLT